MNDMELLIRSELELLTGKLYNGDMTPVVYNLFKDTEDPAGLSKVLKEVSGDNVSIYKPSGDKVKKANSGFDFQDWFAQFTEL